MREDYSWESYLMTAMMIFTIMIGRRDDLRLCLDGETMLTVIWSALAEGALRLRENATTAAFSIAAVSSALCLLLSLDVETMLMAMLWAFTCLLYPLQYFLAPWRRRSRHWFVQYGAMAAYYLPPLGAFYAANAVYTSRHHNSLESTALALLFLALFVSSRSGADGVNITAYSLRDSPRGDWRFVQWMICLNWVDLQRHSDYSSWVLPVLRLGFISQQCLLMVVFFLMFPWAPALDWQTKAVADYMVRKLKSSSSPFIIDDRDGCDDADSSAMDHLARRCRYPFMQRKDGSWISVQDLMQQREGDNMLLLRDVDPDFWLSYSLSRLLARRYFGFPCPEEGDEKVLNFALAQLDSDCYKAFTVVEVQLAFLHDYFFTASLPKIQSDSGMLQRDRFQVRLSTELVVLCIATLWSVLRPRPVPNSIQNIIKVAPFVLISVQTMYLLCLPVHFLLPKYWSPVQIAFRVFNDHRSTGTNKIFSPSATVSFSPPPDQRDIYWSNTIGQYSILRDCGRRPSFKKAAVAWFKERVLLQPSYSFIKHLPVQEEDVPVPNSVRDLVAEVLRGIGGPPTNGTWALHVNKLSTRYWTGTCREETHTDTILIWHIATCYCDMLPLQSDDLLRLPEKDPQRLQRDYNILPLQSGEQPPEEDPQGLMDALSGYCAYLIAFLPEFLPEHSLLPLQSGEQPPEEDPQGLMDHHKAATALSGYCAYLVAFLPEFLPEHSLTTKVVFQRVLQEARDALARTPDIRALPDDLPRGLNVELTAFQKGVKLGRELQNLDTCVRWKVMAEFWAETILYIAPSDNAEAHIEHLAKGGEFVTHLWALLSNAGILKRATGDWVPPTTAREIQSKQCDAPGTHGWRNKQVAAGSSLQR